MRSSSSEAGLTHWQKLSTKTFRPKHVAPLITVKSFEDVDLDAVSHLREYVARTQFLRSREVFFVTLSQSGHEEYLVLVFETGNHHE